MYVPKSLPDIHKMSGHTQDKLQLGFVSATFQLLHDLQVLTECGQTGMYVFLLVILSPGASHVSPRDETQVVGMGSR